MQGDSPLLRVLLVLLTYSIAVVVHNVQSLISLAGALAGSATALLIPPMLELAWINHLEANTNQPEEGPASEGGATTDARMDDFRYSTLAPGIEWLGLGKWWKDKMKCFVLLSLGFLFFLIGTYASLADIVRIYLQG
jgi:proton-coupled amino acid transporter